MDADRLLAAALGRAGKDLAAEAEYGARLWRGTDGSRCYQRQNGPDAELTIVDPGRSALTYVLVQVDGADL